MWTRRELKRKAKFDLKKNYWAIIAVCFLMAILFMEYDGSVQAITQNDTEKEENVQVENVMSSKDAGADASEWIFSGEQQELNETLNPTKGVFSSIFRMAGQTKATMSNIYRTVMHIVENHSGLAVFVGFLAILISLFYEVFIKTIFKIGERRFFLENNLYHETKVGRIFFLLKERKLKGPIWTCLVMEIYLSLWWLTIIGGMIKYYSYKMIPYILAENPDISRKDAFKLSREMMHGNKWRTFILEASFLGWYILMVLSFGFLGIFFINPYTRSTEAHLYLSLRQTAIDQNMTAADQLNDIYLVSAPEGHQTNHYPGLADGKKFRFNVDYHRNYSLVNLVLFFFTAAFIGWCWEVFLHLVEDGIFVNRGTMLGPWLPIYGVGGVGALVILKKFINKPALTFGLTMVLCGVIEYFTSWYLEMSKGVKWWDYSGYLLNLNGRICLEGLLTFAVAGCAFIYIIAPRLDTLFNKIPKRNRYYLCAALILLFGVDGVYSHFHPNTGIGITDYGLLPSEQKILTGLKSD